MKLRRNEFCPIHRSLSCCGREQARRERRLRLGVQRIEDPHQLLFLTYLLTGSALLIGRFVPLALAVLAPVIVNIAVMHCFVPSGRAEISLAGLVTVLEVFLAWCYRAAFRPLLRATDEITLVETRRVARTP